jgi:DNA-binding XRE family transcriptional regulator
MERMQAVYYRAADGSQPVDDAISELPVAYQVVLDNQIDRLNLLGPADPPIAFPHSSQIAGELCGPRGAAPLPRSVPPVAQSVRSAAPVREDDAARTAKRDRNRRGAMVRLHGTHGRRAPYATAGSGRGCAVSGGLAVFTDIGKLSIMDSPIGSTAARSRGRRARSSAAYRAEQERLAPFEAIARMVIARRTALGITQRELADRMGTSHSAISRIESGQYPTTADTLRRLAHALGERFVMGFERGPIDAPERDIVAV